MPAITEGVDPSTMAREALLDLGLDLPQEILGDKAAGDTTLI